MDVAASRAEGLLLEGSPAGDEPAPRPARQRGGRRRGAPRSRRRGDHAASARPAREELRRSSWRATTSPTRSCVRPHRGAGSRCRGVRADGGRWAAPTGTRAAPHGLASPASPACAASCSAGPSASTAWCTSSRSWSRWERSWPWSSGGPGRGSSWHGLLGNLAFVALFLTSSPTSGLLWSAGATEGELGHVSVPPLSGPVVVVVLDEFPVTAIIRGDGTLIEKVAT